MGPVSRGSHVDESTCAALDRAKGRALHRRIRGRRRPRARSRTSRARSATRITGIASARTRHSAFQFISEPGLRRVEVERGARRGPTGDVYRCFASGARDRLRRRRGYEVAHGRRPRFPSPAAHGAPPKPRPPPLARLDRRRTAGRPRHGRSAAKRVVVRDRSAVPGPARSSSNPRPTIVTETELDRSGADSVAPTRCSTARREPPPWRSGCGAVERVHGRDNSSSHAWERAHSSRCVSCLWNSREVRRRSRPRPECIRAESRPRLERFRGSASFGCPSTS